GVGEPGGRPVEPAALLAASGRRGLSRLGRGTRAGDQRVGRGDAGGVADRAAGGGWCTGAESGDAAPEDQEIASAVLPCFEEEGPEGSVGGVWAVLRGLPGGGGEAAGRRSGCGISSGKLPASAAVRDGVRRRAAAGCPRVTLWSGGRRRQA